MFSFRVFVFWFWFFLGGGVGRGGGERKAAGGEEELLCIGCDQQVHTVVSQGCHLAGQEAATMGSYLLSKSLEENNCNASKNLVLGGI